MPESPAGLLDAWLARRLPPAASAWLAARVDAVSGGDRRASALAFGMAPRAVGRADLAPTAEESAAAHAARPGWSVARWGLAQAARARLILALPADDPARFAGLLGDLFDSADVAEAVALYQALPILPHPAAFVRRAIEGVRSSIKPLFVAVAHANPFPADHFDESAWNQLVLKCLFVGVALDPVVGLDRRANADLARMLVDFARERRAAGRPVPPELWRCVGPFARGRWIDDLRIEIDAGHPTACRAAALALAASPDPVAAEILDVQPELVALIRNRSLSWASIASDD